MNRHHSISASSRPLLFACTLFASTGAFGAGFSIMEQGVSGLGSAFAGSAAVAEDATTIFYNPAGLTRLTRPELVAGGHLIAPSADFDNGGSEYSSAVFPAPPFGVGGVPIAGNDGGGGGVLAFVPNFYLSYPVHDRVTAGLGLNAPFGLKTDYDEGWVGRYHTISSELKTINIAPSVGIQATDQLSFGLGINVQYADARLTNAVDFGLLDALPLAAGGFGGAFGLGGPGASDGFVKLDGDNWNIGYTVGALFEPRAGSRLGLTYRSKIVHELSGDATFSHFTSAATLTAIQFGTGLFTNAPITAKVTLPETVSLSGYHKLNDQWAVLADATWTHWSRVTRVPIEFASAQPTQFLTLNWQNVWRYSFGAHYRHDAHWTARAGFAYDESPTPNATFRSPRVPDNDRYWLTVGGSYRWSERLRIDAAYAHLFVPDTSIANTDSSGHLLSGSFDASVNIFSTQVVWQFL